MSASSPETLVDMLRGEAGARPDGPACTYLGEDGEVRAALGYRALDLSARAIAARCC